MEDARSSSEVSRNRRNAQRGSALLIVFVFAAIVAISLYMEMPVAAFEAQRQREQLLVDRGDEYARAVKLFVRKTGHYPASIKDLEDTNRMRFLRHEFVDPFTGKSDWRLLHAGPGGMLLDSKVNPVGSMPGVPGQAGNGANATAGGSGTPTSTAAFPSSGGGASTGGGFGSSSGGAFGGSSSSSGFGGSSFGNSSQPNGASTAPNTTSIADSAPPEVVVQQPRQRGPAIAANGSGQTGASAEASVDTASPPLPPDVMPNAGAGANAGANISANPPAVSLPTTANGAQGFGPGNAQNTANAGAGGTSKALRTTQRARRI